MKKYISLALAVVAAASCSKVSTDQESAPYEIESQGESITLSVEGTKVALDGQNSLQFEAGDKIVAVSSQGAVATLINSTNALTTFTGTFSSNLLPEGESFTFYVNCGEAPSEGSFTPAYAQNGKPWLIAKQENAQRGKDNTYQLSATFSAPENTIGIAIKSSYPCTVDFHTIDGNQTYKDLPVSESAPYILNVTSGFEGGFYLAVHQGDQTMYTSYGTSSTTPVTSNQVVSVKAPFTPFSGTISIAGFQTTYNYYNDGLSSTDPNTPEYYWMNEGTLTCTLEGISSSLINSITFNNGETQGEYPLVRQTGTQTYIANIPVTETNKTIGAKTISAQINFQDGISEIIKNTEERFITGLPYKSATPSNSGDNAWTGSANSWNSNYVRLYTHEISKSFYAHTDIDVNVTYNLKVNTHLVKMYFWLYNGSNELKTFNDYNYNTSIEHKETIATKFTTSNSSIICKSKAGNTGLSGGSKNNIDIYSIAVLYKN